MKFLRKIISSVSFTAYHGSEHKVSKFNADLSPKGGCYFTSNPKLALTYGSPNSKIPMYLYTVKISFDKPLIIDCKGQPFSNISFEGKHLKTDQIVISARKQGYDGVIFNNVIDPGPKRTFKLTELFKNPVTTYCVCKSSNIKVLKVTGPF